MLIWIGVSLGADVTLKWDANTESDLAGYKLYHGKATRTYVDPPCDTELDTIFTITDLDEGVTYYFALTAYDTSGNESNYSEEVTAIFIDITSPFL